MRRYALLLLPLLPLPACSLWDGLWGEDNATPEADTVVFSSSPADSTETESTSELPTFVDIRNFVIMSEKTAGAGQPSNDQYAELASKGYSGIINLRPSSEPQPEGAGKAALAAGLSYTVIPVTSQSLSIKDAHLLEEALSESGPGSVLIHCRSGNRVGALWGLYRGVTEGLSVSEAVLAGQEAGMRSPELAKLVARALSF